MLGFATTGVATLGWLTALASFYSQFLGQCLFILQDELAILILSSFQFHHYAYTLMVDILEHVRQRLLQTVKFLCQE